MTIVMSQCLIRKYLNGKRVLWDLIKYRVRQFTIKYAKKKAKERRQELLQVETSLKQADEMLATDPSETNHEKLADLKMK